MPPARPTPDRTLVEQFRDVAAQAADRIAVDDGTRRLTYRELDGRTDALAERIRRRVPAGQLVGVCLPRSVELVVAVLAVAKSGCVHVPMDPHYPMARLRHVATDTRLALLVVDARGRTVATDLGVAALGVGDLRGSGAAPPGPDLDSPAYVIHTSGSTGQPKGVVVSHANLSALLASTEDLFDFSPEDVWTLFHSTSFDFSVWEMWGALAHGARLVVVDEQSARSPERFLELLTRERVTFLNMVPSVFRHLVEAYVGAPRPLALRHVVFGGEEIHLPSVAAFRDACDPPPTMVNMYGITEVTVHATARVITDRDRAAGGATPIGIPLPHLRIHVLDDNLRPVPDGEAGELWIGGTGVAVGYLHRPELTAERFVTLSNGLPPGRYYRSGDVGRWVGGELEYLGRRDQQVKVRGHRIELGEVEAAIEADEVVSRAAAAVSLNHADEPILVAYYVPRAELDAAAGGAHARQLRSRLAATLPAHLVPGRLVPVRSLPHTASGKLDRARLGPVGGPSKDAEPARDPETVARSAWQRVLKVGRVEADDDFFDLGGHSISAVRVIAAVRHGLGHDVDVRVLLEHPEFADFVRALSPED